MAAKKIITVIGATGAQGGGLARAILADRDGPFGARVVARDPNSDKAKALAALGAEVMAGDVDDPASIQRAFQGAHGAYCVTFFWAHLSPEKEQAQAKAMAEAARTAGLRHVIWSTLEDTRLKVPLTDNRMPSLGGKYKVPHFDSKGGSDDFFAGLPATWLLTSFYWENLIYFGMGPKRGPDGKLAFGLPMGDQRLSAMAVEDIGRCAYGIFKRESEYVGKRVGIAGEHLTGAEMAAALGRALGEDVLYQAIPPEVYRSLGFPGAEDLGNMFQYFRDFSTDVCAARSLEISRSLNPKLQTFEAWLTENKSKIPLQ